MIRFLMIAFALATSCFDASADDAVVRRTKVSIVGDHFQINGKPTYQGRVWEGRSIEGLLFNSRMVQGIFDDLNPETRANWVYPDTGKWDPERNTNEFIAAMPSWRNHGLLAFTINLQGGSPQGYSKDQPWHNSALTDQGELRPDYMARLARILDKADELGMVAIVGVFYFGQDERLKDEAAVKRALDNSVDWLLEKGYTNLLLEVNNECNVHYDHAILKPDRVHELIKQAKNRVRGNRRLLVGTSYGGGTIPRENVVRASDFLLLHGNGVSDPDKITQMVQKTRKVPGYQPMPILFNEDDHFNFDQPKNNFFSAISEHASWGYFDYRMKDEGFVDGYQSVPVDWTISGLRKRAFFSKLKEVVGEQQSQPPDYSIPTRDLSARADLQTVVDREKGQYLGHPTTVLLEDGKTILTVYPKGHGRGAIQYKKSSDGGKTWSDRLETPSSWATSLETPTIHRVIDKDGRKRLIVFSGLYPIRMASSENDGQTWTELKPIGNFGGIVAMASVEPLRDGPGRYMALFHDDGRFIRANAKPSKPPVFHVYKTLSSDGGLTWSQPEIIATHAQAHLCEPGLIRSPDGKRIAVLLRENSRKFNSFVIFSDDEGQTWTTPQELNAALTGDRHVGKYLDDGRLLLSFRDTTHSSPTKGDWVLWVGSFEDITTNRQGQYRARLMKNHRASDCAYPAIERLPNNELVFTTYGHWTPKEPAYVISIRLKPSTIDEAPLFKP